MTIALTPTDLSLRTGTCDLQTLAFGGLKRQPGDALLALMRLCRDDPNPDKIDVGVGVYRDADGVTPVMRAVKAAEQRLLADQTTKSYLGSEGDVRFTELLGEIAFGASSSNDARVGVQTPGGTGALRLGAQLLACGAPDRTIWTSTPTWPNHGPIMRQAGLRTAEHGYFDASAGTIAFDAMLRDLDGATAGDILLLHGCCHNPTGTAFSALQWRALAELCNARGLIPFIDTAYQGLGDGLEEDVTGMREFLGEVECWLLAYSCDKNFGLYRERVGALWVQTRSSSAAALVRENILALARSLWSMPPDHGAAIVRTILDDAALTSEWRRELDIMRNRINTIRLALSRYHPVLSAVGKQRGLFSLLPLDPAAVDLLRARHGIYMVANGRTNIAGLTEASLPRFAEALRAHLPAEA